MVKIFYLINLHILINFYNLKYLYRILILINLIAEGVLLIRAFYLEFNPY